MNILIFIFGLIVGSFLNCVIYRLESGKSFVKGRSYCPNCKHELSWLDLIPVLSFLFLKGKCRYCRKKISWQYPIVEVSTGLIFLLIFQQFGLGLISLMLLLIIFSLLIVIFVFDLKHFIIPDSAVFSAIILAFAYQLKNADNLMPYILSALCASGFFLLIFLISKGKWIGFGDVKLGFLMGMLLGFPNIIVSLYFAFLIGAIIGIGLILAKRKKMKSEIPFGPFLIIGTLFAFLWGNQIVNWYLSLFL